MLIAAEALPHQRRLTSRRWIRKPAHPALRRQEGGGVGGRPGARNDAGEARRIQPQAEIGSEVRIQKSTEALGRIFGATASRFISRR